MCLHHIESDYYMWLLDRVDVLRGEHMNYLLLMQQLFTTKYEYFIGMDRNRALAGSNLRKYYADEAGFYVEDVYQGPCTVLEMLVALAEVISFDTQSDLSIWFWEMIDNLGLTECTDENFDSSFVDSRLHLWMNHNYDPDGHGGLFYIPGFKGDMRKMELWDQKNAYMTTLHPVGI